MGANKEAIAATLDLLAELSPSVSVSVPLEDFGDWMEALGYDAFSVCRREGRKGSKLSVHATGFFGDTTYVAVDTRADKLLGHVVPPRKDEEPFLRLPIAEVANLRAGDR
jgi:hypothetical protein